MLRRICGGMYQFLNLENNQLDLVFDHEAIMLLVKGCFFILFSTNLAWHILVKNELIDDTS